MIYCINIQVFKIRALNTLNINGEPIVVSDPQVPDMLGVVQPFFLNIIKSLLYLYRRAVQHQACQAPVI